MKKTRLAALAAPLVLAASVSVTPQHFIFDPEQKIRYAEKIIETFYVDTIDVNHTVEQGIIAMLKTLDPHSSYTNADETRELTEPLQGGFSGIGITFNMLDDTLYVVSTVASGPSEKVGLRAGDRIIMANDTLLSGAKRTNTDVRSTLRGPKGTPVILKVRRPGTPELISFRVIRDEIPIHSVDTYYIAQPGIGYVRISRFAETTAEEVRAALKSLKKQGMKKLIIDLESNGGGYMQPATEIADMFLNKGDTIVFTKGARSPIQYYTADGRGGYRDMEVVLLVDQNSASASEILAGALQDNDRATIIGRRTFGKGLVQRPFPLPDGSMIRLTTSRYYTPSGRSIQKPYSDGEEAYRADIRHRYDSGELTADTATVAFADSLRYRTRSGRIVYGGGGIMPDIIVPLDTLYFTPYYRDLMARGLPSRFALQYVDKHREQLHKLYPSESNFLTDFHITDTMLAELRQMAEKDSISYDSIQASLSHKHLAAIIKGLIGRDIFEQGTYYKETNVLNPTYRAALKKLQRSSAH